MEKINQIKQLADNLRLTNLRNEPEKLLHQAQIDGLSHTDFLHKVLLQEVEQRQQTELLRRISMARLPKYHDLDLYDFKMANGLVRAQLEQLRELLWLEQNYNIIFMGPSGVGKTFVAAGLTYEAVKNGYKAYFYTMSELSTIFKMREITSSAMSAYNRLLKAHLLVIDDIMLFPMKKNEAVAFFNLINQLFEKCSIVITTNKSPREWGETLEDEVLATALLDRLLYRCEVVKLKGKSYRMENRKTIF